MQSLPDCAPEWAASPAASPSTLSTGRAGVTDMRPEDYERVQRELHRLQSNPRLPVEQQLRLAQGAFLLAMQHDTLLREPTLRQLLMADFLTLDSWEPGQLCTEMRRAMAEGCLPVAGRVFPRGLNNVQGFNSQAFMFGQADTLPDHLDPFWWFAVVLRRMDALDIELDGDSHIFRPFDSHVAAGPQCFPNQQWQGGAFLEVLQQAGMEWTQQSLRRARSQALLAGDLPPEEVLQALCHFTASGQELASTTWDMHSPAVRGFAGLLADPGTPEECDEA